MKALYTLGLAVLVPVGLIAAAIGLALAILSGNWLVLWIGLVLVVVGLLLSFGQMALIGVRMNSASEKYMRQMIVEQRRGIFPGITAPLIGEDIPWTGVLRHVFRVVDFNRTDTQIVDDKVVDTGPGKPYGYLLVESPLLTQRGVLPIFHSDDFRLAASVFDEPKLAALVPTEELLVSYAPRKVTSAGISGDPTHAYHYLLAPAGTLARYYDYAGGIHKQRSAPELLFGAFTYEGEIKVGVNENPAL